MDQQWDVTIRPDGRQKDNQSAETKSEQHNKKRVVLRPVGGSRTALSTQKKDRDRRARGRQTGQGGGLNKKHKTPTQSDKIKIKIANGHTKYNKTLRRRNRRRMAAGVPST